MIGYCPLASGSKGNSIYFGTSQTRILVDAGLSGKKIKEGLAQLDVDISTIDAILVTHEHTDHIRGLRVLAYRLGIPVFANADTAKAIVQIFGATPNFSIFTTGETFQFRDLQIHPFSIQHDSVDPVAFTIDTPDVRVGFCTDLGFATSLVKARLRDCDYLYVEANHKPGLVHSSPRPLYYKQRVLSRSGHLSNEACGELLGEVHHSRLKHAHLAHLSGECNCPNIAIQTVSGILQEKGINLDLSIAPQDQLGKVISFEAETALEVP